MNLNIGNIGVWGFMHYQFQKTKLDNLYVYIDKSN